MTDEEKIADRLLALINSRPITPTREEIVTDEDSKRIREKVERITVRKIFLVATQDPSGDAWYVETSSDTMDMIDRKKSIRVASEGGSLKEALMNLADKLTV